MHALLTMLRSGDEVYTLRLDRLARSVRDFLAIAAAIEEAGATLHCILQPIETKTATGKMFMTMLAAFSAFETEIRRERQMAGIAKAQEHNRYRKVGRAPSYDRAVISHMFTEQKKTPRQIAKHLGCVEWTVRRALKDIASKRDDAMKVDRAPQSLESSC